MKVFRPRDSSWSGVDSGPHVGTIIPVAETRIREPLQQQKYLTMHAPRHELSITPVISEQTFKDTLRTLNLFFDGYDPAGESSSSSPANVSNTHINVTTMRKEVEGNKQGRKGIQKR